MKSMWNITKVYFWITFIGIIFLYGCSDNVEDKVPFKGAKTSVIQGIADNVLYIQEVLDEKSYEIGDGVSVIEATFTYCTRPTRMFVVEVDLSKNVTIVTSTPDNQNSIGDLQQTVKEQAEKATAVGRNVLVGINGHSAGICYKDGLELKSTFDRYSEQVFYVLDNGKAYVTTVPELNLVKDRVVDAVSGSHALLVDGETCRFIVDEDAMSFSPRTFVGVSKNHDRVYLFVIDGDQIEYSNGMRLEDIMLVCQGAGCYQAMDLEGGEASTIVCRTDENGIQLMNKPSSGTEKPVSNGLQVIVKNN